MYCQSQEVRLYAEMAERLGKVLRQYESINSTEKYEISLMIVVLQNLLTHFCESNDKLTRDFSKSFNIENLNIPKHIDIKDIIEFYKNMRDVLSHPSIDENQIGYTIQGEESIGSVRFYAPVGYGRRQDFNVTLTVQELSNLTLGLINFLTLPLLPEQK